MNRKDFSGLGILNLPNNLMYFLAVINGIICGINGVYFHHNNSFFTAIDSGLLVLVIIWSVINFVFEREEKLSTTKMFVAYFFGFIIIFIFNQIVKL